MIPIFFEKYANFDRDREPCRIAVPFPKGEVFDCGGFVIKDKGKASYPTQASKTSIWRDGSIKWAYVDFLADLPKNKSREYFLDINGQKTVSDPIEISSKKDGVVINSGAERFELNNKLDFYLNGKRAVVDGGWEVVKNGCVACTLKARGSHGGFVDFEITVTAYKRCPWIRIDYRIINKEEDEFILLKSLSYDVENKGEDRFTIGTSNYLTKYTQGEDISVKIDDEWLINEANEHFPEVFYGTFFGDYSGNDGGSAVTVFQAYQNYPSEIRLNSKKMHIGILAAEDAPVKFYKGMAKTSTIFIHKHDAQTTKEQVNLRSLMFQMPDVGVVSSEVYERAGVLPDVFLPEDRQIRQVEVNLLRKLETRGKAYGFLHWGDNVDLHYTHQGRGGGRPVWVNNEYDFGHSVFAYYLRTGARKALDTMLVSVKHQMDVDIIHKSDNPLRQDGQVTHSADHVSGDVAISHQWVEGLLDYYHFTGDREAYHTAVRMGNNIIKILDQPRYKKKGGVNARETGWALRAFCALYNETYDDKWLKHCEGIVEHFKAWKEEYGSWLAPYTDHVVIRVPFMISIAVGSLMRYYDVTQREDIKNMIIEAVDDMIEHTFMPSGYFLYKELASLNRNAGNTTVLEALTIACRLTGRAEYLDYGKATFTAAVSDTSLTISPSKHIYEDAVILSGNSSKGVGQSFIPLLTYYTALVKTGKADFLNKAFGFYN